MDENNEYKYVDLDGLSYFKAKIDDKYVSKEIGKGLSTEDYTTAEKSKLDGIETGAEENVIESIVVNGTTATINNKTASVTIQAGAIDSISVNGTAQTIDANKNVDITVPTKVSDLTNDSGFITNAVNNLTNYYKKSETYTQAEVNALIGAISSLTIQIVQTLPTQDISTSTIYFVPKTTTQTNNIYDEYIYANNAWELIGTTEIDLSNYYTKNDTDSNFLKKTNTIAYTPSANYHPATKKYVDDAISTNITNVLGGAY